MASNNPLSVLSNVSECSISGLFQELLNKGMKSPNTATGPLEFGDSEGSDFKRLLHKKSAIASKTQTAAKPTATNIVTSKKRRAYHQGSPDFRPVVYLEQKPSTPNNSRFVDTIYNFFFQHEDRYFNHDRVELSKDIFPVGYEQRA